MTRAGRVAQRLERSPYTRNVPGSNPGLPIRGLLLEARRDVHCARDSICPWVQPGCYGSSVDRYWLRGWPSSALHSPETQTRDGGDARAAGTRWRAYQASDAQSAGMTGRTNVSCSAADGAGGSRLSVPRSSQSGISRALGRSGSTVGEDSSRPRPCSGPIPFQSSI